MSEDRPRRRGGGREADESREATRRCVVCRNTDRKHALLRFVIGPHGEVLFDVRHKLPGRGINVSPTADCLEKAARGAFRRGARGTSVVLPADPKCWIADEIVVPLVRHYGELVSLGRRSGQLLIGAHQVERAAQGEALAAYLLATDASAGTRQKYERNASRKGLEVLGLLDRRRLGELVGREEAVVLGWVTGPLLERFQSIERQLRSLGYSDGAASAARIGDDRDDDGTEEPQDGLAEEGETQSGHARRGAGFGVNEM